MPRISASRQRQKINPTRELHSETLKQKKTPTEQKRKHIPAELSIPPASFTSGLNVSYGNRDGMILK